MLKYVICCLVVLSACDDGYPLKVTVNAPAGAVGANGANGTDGIDGQDGANGKDGQDGKDGSSCSVEQIVGGALISCTDGTMAVVLDGVDGTDGQDGQDGLSFLVGYVDPCGNQSGVDEIIFYDADGNFYAWYLNVGLVKLDENVLYQTTDAHKSKFKIIAGELVDVSC